MQLVSITRAHNPLDRPLFDAIKRRIQRLNPNRQNPVDLVISMVSDMRYCDI